jgi:hypothetical protein
MSPRTDLRKNSAPSSLSSSGEPPTIDEDLVGRISAAAERTARQFVASSLRWGRLSIPSGPPEHATVNYLQLCAPELLDVDAGIVGDVADAFIDAERAAVLAINDLVERDLSREDLIDAIRENRHPAAWMLGREPQAAADLVASTVPPWVTSFDLAFVCGAVRRFDRERSVELLSTAAKLAACLPAR